VGLPFAPSEASVRACLHKLNEWTRKARRYIKLGYEQFFWTNPAEYNHSEALFRSTSLVTVLQRHCGLRYNSAKIAEDAEFDSRDSFIHGAILCQGGTCATIPVVLAAVGRRLGYPIKLVHTRGAKYGHGFARWDDPRGERLNLEATNNGLSTHDDNYYRTGRYELTLETEEAGGFLKSQTPRQELGHFLAERALHWGQVRNWRDAVEARIWSSAMDPGNQFHENMVKVDLNAWHDDLEAKKPSYFPSLYIQTDGRRFPSLSLEMEQNAMGKAALDSVLNDEVLVRKYWEPMRRGLKLSQIPHRINASYKGTRCEVTIESWRPTISTNKN
jgi:hypothetical protein